MTHTHTPCGHTHTHTLRTTSDTHSHLGWGASLQGIFANAAVSSISPQVFLRAWDRDMLERDRGGVSSGDLLEHAEAARGNEGGQGGQGAPRMPHPGEVMEGVTEEGGGGWRLKTELVSMIVSSKMSHPGPVRVAVRVRVESVGRSRLVHGRWHQESLARMDAGAVLLLHLSEDYDGPDALAPDLHATDQGNTF